MDYNGSEYVARTNQLRRLMVGPSDPAIVIVKIQEIVDARITELNKRIDEQSKGGATSGPIVEPG